MRVRTPASSLPMEALPFWCGKGPRESRRLVLRWSRSGLANDQIMGQRPELEVLFGGLLDQDAHCAFGYVLDRLPGGRKRRPDDLRHRRVIEASNRDVGRNI